MAREPPRDATTAAELVQRESTKRAGDLSAILRRTAEALEQSAVLAEEHAERQRRSGDTDAAAKEHEAAERAGEAARRARARADEAADAAAGRAAHASRDPRPR